MVYSIEVDPTRALVRVRLAGVIDKAAAREMAAAAIKTGRDHDLEKFLVDWSQATVAVSVLDIYDYAQEQHELGVRPTDMVAIVAARDHAAHDFFETVAHNDGLSSLRCFRSANEALKWLQDGSEVGSQPPS